MWIGDTCYMEKGDKRPKMRTGSIVYPGEFQAFFKDGVPHRANGPAVVYFDSKGRKTLGDWYYDGKFVRAGKL